MLFYTYYSIYGLHFARVQYFSLSQLSLYTLCSCLSLFTVYTLCVLYSSFQCPLNSLSPCILWYLRFTYLSKVFFPALSLLESTFLCNHPTVCFPSVFSSLPSASLLHPFSLRFFTTTFPSASLQFTLLRIQHPICLPPASHFSACINPSASFEFPGFEVSERRQKELQRALVFFRAGQKVGTERRVHVR